MPPEWVSGYPNVTNILTTTADVNGKIDVAGKIYVVVVTNGAAAPTSQQVKDGQDGSGTPVGAGLSGYVIANANIEETINISNLTADTEYDIYAVAESLYPLLQDCPEKIDIKTEDGNPPEWSATYPKIGLITTTTVDTKVKITENGVVYGVIVPSGDPAPTSSQVINGQDGSGSSVPTGHYGLVPAITETEETITFTNLITDSSYDIYLVAEDIYGNVQLTPELLEITVTESDFGGIKGIRSYGGGTLYIYWDGASVAPPAYITSYDIYIRKENDLSLIHI